MNFGTALRFTLVMVSVGPVLAMGGLKPLNDGDMAEVTGSEGIALDLELRVNADSDGNALSESQLKYDATDTALKGQDGDSVGCNETGNPCILALRFANRNAGGGEWLVLKDLFGVLRFNDFQLDGTRLPNTESAFPANDDRFVEAGGGTFDPNGKLAASLSFPDTAGFTSDIEWKLNVGRTAVQFGAEAFLPSADNDSSFLALRVDDTQQNTARIDMGGRIQLFGF